MSSSNQYRIRGSGKSEFGPVHSERSGLFACISIVLILVVAIAMLVSQRNFARMFSEFELKLPLATRVACSPMLPLGLLGMATVAIFMSIHAGVHRFANRWNAMLIFSSVIVLAGYLWGMLSPLMQLTFDLSK